MVREFLWADTMSAEVASGAKGAVITTPFQQLEKFGVIFSNQPEVL